MLRKWIRMFNEGRKISTKRNAMEESVQCINENRSKTEAHGSNFRVLQRYATDGNDYLKNFQNKTWICNKTPETKLQSLEKRHTSSPKSKKEKPPLSSRKSCAPSYGLSKIFVS
ncbi:hypothetical protein CEXT_778931 [Caerostris extrusa]|uniref:Uncharacterized protein n=1 Tax=Caerostris extrusa TaxID=172846 RepID=A0AAV4XU73_CAEEX|nr:hypothetical protein CEXT_778931 [Caerostris extrusa]